MSGLIGGLSYQVTSVDDQRTSMMLDTIDWREIVPAAYHSNQVSFGDSFQTDWWPYGCIDMAWTLGVLDNAHYDSPYPVSGSNGRFAIVGYTRDAYGSPIGGATVKLFRTADDSLQNTVVSDGNGLYSVTSPYADGHYLIVYKAGPPDICGTTVNTLTPG